MSNKEIQITDSEDLAREESQLSSLVYDMSRNAQAAMGNMLKSISEIDQCSAGITEEIDRCKENAAERKKSLDEEKDTFQKAIYNVLDMLNKF